MDIMYVNSFKFLVETSGHIKFKMTNYIADCLYKIVERAMKEHCSLYTQRGFTVSKNYIDWEFLYLESLMNKKNERLLCTDSKKYLENLIQVVAVTMYLNLSASFAQSRMVYTLLKPVLITLRNSHI